MKRLISGFDLTVNRALQFLSICLLAVMTVVVFAQVVFRIFHASITWSEELSIYTMVWCVFLGAALCCRKGTMIGLEIFRSILPKKLQKAVILLASLCTVAFLLFLTYVGVQIASQMWNQSTPILKWHMGGIYAAIPVGCFLMALNTIFSTYETLEGPRS